MESIYKKYRDGEVSRREVYKIAAEVISLSPERLEFVYEEYFKPSQEEVLENEVGSLDGGNYMLYEDEKFEEFIFYISKNDAEKIREIKELASTDK